MNIRVISICSLIFNFLFLLAAGLYFSQAEKSNAPRPTTIPGAFHWSQIEAADYPAYIANLRRIGCPEQTIRDIITADVASLNQEKRYEAPSEVSNAATAIAQASSMEQSTLVNRLLETPQKNNFVHEDSSAMPNSAVLPLEVAHSIVSSPTPVLAREMVSASEDEAKMPLALLEPPAKVKSDPEQLSQLEGLRKKFVQDVGGQNQNPFDPNYLHRWLKAQASSNDLFYTWFGQDAYVTQVNLAAQQAEPLAR